MSLFSEFSAQWESREERKAMFKRFGAFVSIFGLMWIYELIKRASLPQNSICVIDYLFEATKGLNRYFAGNQSARHGFLIFSSAMMDLLVISLYVHYVAYARTFRILFILIFLYGSRQLIQSVFLMRFPDDYLWEFPGIYSFVVPYQRTNDFFFSGHLGFSAVAVLEFREKKLNGWTIYAISTLVVETLAMLILRGHYSIDLISGIIGAHYFFIFGEESSKIFERLLKKYRYSCDKTKENPSVSIEEEKGLLKVEKSE